MKIRENAEITVIDVSEDLGNHVAGELKQTLEAQNTLKNRHESQRGETYQQHGDRRPGRAWQCGSDEKAVT